MTIPHGLALPVRRLACEGGPLAGRLVHEQGDAFAATLANEDAAGATLRAVYRRTEVAGLTWYEFAGWL